MGSVYRLPIPAATGGLITGIMLALARVAGETMDRVRSAVKLKYQ